MAAPPKPTPDQPSAIVAQAPSSFEAPEPPEAGVAPARVGALRSGRVTIVAKTDSWLQIQGGGQAPLLARVLRVGERYVVPDVPGLMLTASDAAALEIAIDGEVMPPLGSAGVVRRDIPLDPDRLRAALP